MSKELGTLVIVVLKAQHLIDNHTFYKQDPYVKLSLSGATKQTPVDPKGGQHPVWDAELRFPISKDPSKSNRTLNISVFSEEKKDDELLGEGTVDITDTLKSGEFDGAPHFLSPKLLCAQHSDRLGAIESQGYPARRGFSRDDLLRSWSCPADTAPIQVHEPL
jgi:Ca2+-dependent lipid-binding protein